MWCALQLSGSSEHPLKLTQFHFTAWPDDGVPDATLILAFHRRVKKEHKSSKGPMVVLQVRVSVCGSVWHSPIHSFPSSAGVGRTGTFITIDHVLEQVEKEGVVDIPGVIQKIREQRMKMVQTVVCCQLFFVMDICVEGNAG